MRKHAAIQQETFTIVNTETDLTLLAFNLTTSSPSIMNRFTTITRTGLTAMRNLSQSPFPTGVIVAGRSTSWIAFEQPNLALYVKHPKPIEKPTDTHGSKEDDAAPKTASATSAKTTGEEKSRQRNSTTQPTATGDKPDSTKDKGTATCSSPDLHFLNTTLINIEGSPATWACK